MCKGYYIKEQPGPGKGSSVRDMGWCCPWAREEAPDTGCCVGGSRSWSWSQGGQLGEHTLDSSSLLQQNGEGRPWAGVMEMLWHHCAKALGEGACAIHPLYPSTNTNKR